jgi:TorA maturation chaperone TorD
MLYDRTNITNQSAFALCVCWLAGLFQKHLVDGPLLLRLDEGFARESLGLHHALQRRKLMRAVEQLKKSQVRNFKVMSKFSSLFCWCCACYLPTLKSSTGTHLCMLYFTYKY